jgi:hypothetical protein
MTLCTPVSGFGRFGGNRYLFHALFHPVFSSAVSSFMMINEVITVLVIVVS